MWSDTREFIAENLIQDSTVFGVSYQLAVFVFVFPGIFQIQNEQPKTLKFIMNHNLPRFEIPMHNISFVNLFQHTKLHSHHTEQGYFSFFYDFIFKTNGSNNHHSNIFGLTIWIANIQIVLSENECPIIACSILILGPYDSVTRTKYVVPLIFSSPENSIRGMHETARRSMKNTNKLSYQKITFLPYGI